MMVTLIVEIYYLLFFILDKILNCVLLFVSFSCVSLNYYYLILRNSMERYWIYSVLLLAKRIYIVLKGYSNHFSTTSQ